MPVNNYSGNINDKLLKTKANQSLLIDCVNKNRRYSSNSRVVTDNTDNGNFEIDNDTTVDNATNVYASTANSFFRTNPTVVLNNGWLLSDGPLLSPERYRKVKKKVTAKRQVPKDDDNSKLKYSKSRTYKASAMDTNSNSTKVPSNSQSYSSKISPELEAPSEPVASTSSQTLGRGSLSTLYHGTWPVERGLWQSVPTSLPQPTNDMTSVMSFASSAGSTGLFEQTTSVHGKTENTKHNINDTLDDSQQQLGAKVDMVYGLLAMLGAPEKADMGHTLLALSSSPESCLAMRQSGCIPLLVQLVHSEADFVTRQQATQALHNLVQAQPDEKLRRREMRVLKLLEQLQQYCETALAEKTPESDISDLSIQKDDKHPGQIIANLMKLSFDEGHRIAICQLGGLQVIAKLIEVDHVVHSSDCEEAQCVTLRRYGGMALTNLTFGDGNNKALLCSLRNFMSALVKQLYSSSEDLKQVTASVLRNLSWRADSASKQVLREVCAVKGLGSAAMTSRKEATLKSVLSALWNLSAHCSINKADICSVDGLLAFIVTMLSYKSPSKTLAIVENAGGILRNVSSHIAVRDDYRAILREHNCLQVLLQQLRSPSLTVVSNACGTLWNLSAKCSEDQKALWDMGAVPMLRSLTPSKHKMISMGSSAALKNLLSARPNGGSLTRLDSTAKALGLPALPTLGARKQRALEQELDHNLAETCENIEPSLSPTTTDKFDFVTNGINRVFVSQSFTHGIRQVALSESRESVTSTHSDSVYERVVRTLPKRSESPSGSVKTETESIQTNIPPVTNKFSQSDTLTQDGKNVCEATDKRFIKRYEHSHYQQKPLSSNMWSSKTYNASSSNVSTRSNQIRNRLTTDEQITSEQPIDYSQKYSECDKEGDTSKHESSESKKNKVEVAYGNYAITDLDQPTDYSLRYAEDGVDSDLPKASKVDMYSNQESEDTIKTYCTEGTPYETPFNFSTATSMSDLRVDATLHDNDNQGYADKTKSPKESEVVRSDEKDSCSVEDISKMGTEETSQDKKYSSSFKSGYSSGILSPEKPVNYCEEGTPGYFSRVSSLSSLNSMAVNETKEKIELTEKCNTPPFPDPSSMDSSSNKMSREEGNRDRESKVVTFGTAVDYAEETPLMFSRTSSLASLDSVEQHSIHDDRSSVVSDFSRRTSGVVSPSELPDSPTQSIPSTPLRPTEACSSKPRKAVRSIIANNVFPSTSKHSVFEDTMAAYKDENTPIEFSRATSLSSLTIDDEVKIMSDSLQKEIIEQENALQSGVVKKTSNIPIMRTSPKSGLPISINKRSPRQSTSNYTQRTRGLDSSLDATKVYCTEDTPAELSHAGSISNLSELSILTDFSPSKNVVEYKEDEIASKDNESISQEVQSSQTEIFVSDPSTLQKPSETELLSGNRNSTDLSDNSADELVLQQCIQAGFDKVTSNNSFTHQIIVPEKSMEDDTFNISDDNSNSSVDERLLQQCIQAGVDRVTSTAHMINPIPKKIKDDDNDDARSDDSYTSADERLLQECIKVGMARVAINPTTDSSLLVKMEKGKKKSVISKIEEGAISDDGSIDSADEKLLADCIKLGIERVTNIKTEDLSDDSNTSADEKLLQDCIQFGMDRVTKGSADSRLIHGEDDDNASITSADERLLSECINLGIRSVTGEKPQISPSLLKQQAQESAGKPVTKLPMKVEKSSKPTKQVLNEASGVSKPLDMNIQHSLKQKEIVDRFTKSIQTPTLSKTGRITSSASLDSMNSLNPDEKDLLKQCIQAGVARTAGHPVPQIKPGKSTSIPVARPDSRKPFGAERDDEQRRIRVSASYNQIYNYDHRRASKPTHGSSIRHHSSGPCMSTEDHYETQHPAYRESNYTVRVPDSKNVQVPPVTASTADRVPRASRSSNTTQVTGAEAATESSTGSVAMSATPTRCRDTYERWPSECSPLTESSWTGEMRSGSDLQLAESCDNTVCNQSEYVTCADDSTVATGTLLEGNDLSDSSSVDCSEELKYDYCKPRDPDAMLASVDRLTAELVSHASHLHMKQSLQDTWNDSSSTNDLTFPSLSATAPMIMSSKSATENEATSNDIPEENLIKDENDVANYSSLDTNHSTMTDSTIIAREASLLVTAVQKETMMVQSVTSLGSLDLDNMKPPSNMGSLVSLTSNSGHYDTADMSELRDRRHSLSSRSPAKYRRKIPASEIMVRMALSNCSNHIDNWDLFMDNNSTASSVNIDNIKPPSIMNDISDMENSMVSVCSITSEVCDVSSTQVKLDFKTNGLVTNAFESSKSMHSKQPQSLINFMSGSINGISYSDIENINPPSCLNDITDGADISFNEHDTDTIFDTTTDVFEDCLTHTVDRTLQDNETTVYSDANSITPIQSDFCSSSVESTPKKRSKLITPKQRREIAKDRYKTYTVASDSSKEREFIQDLQEIQSTDGDDTSIPSIDLNAVSSGSSTFRKSSKTAKQRRQEDRARFQTQVLENPVFDPDIMKRSIATAEYFSLENEDYKERSLEDRRSLTKDETSGKKTPKQKRIENRDRFRTRTLDDPSSSSPDTSLPNIDTNGSSSSSHVNTEELHNMLEKEANVVLNTLNENKDDFLDSETLSLVSNDEESEHNSMNSVNSRTYHKSWSFSKRLPVIESVIQRPDEVNNHVDISSLNNDDSGNSSDDIEVPKTKVKPKIIKPTSSPQHEEINTEEQEEVKAIRGRRKALYSPQKKVSALPKQTKLAVKSTVTIAAASSSTPKVIPRQPIANRRPMTRVTSMISTSKTTTAISRRSESNTSLKNSKSLPASPKKMNLTKTSPVHKSEPRKPLERQGTFTKEDSTSKTKIPVFGEKSATQSTKIPSSKFGFKPTIPSKIGIGKSTTNGSTSPVKQVLTKSSSLDVSRNKPTLQSRSPSADRDSTTKKRLQASSPIKTSTSNHNLKNQPQAQSSIPRIAQRSYSNASITSTSTPVKSTPVHKTVTSKIASLWKRVEDSRKQSTTVKDKRVWITKNETTEIAAADLEEIDKTIPGIVRSSTFQGMPNCDDEIVNGVMYENVNGGGATIVLRRHKSNDVVRRVSDLAPYANGVPETIMDVSLEDDIDCHQRSQISAEMPV